jgi:formate-dependent nitrite reductase membrane component NrfD
MIGAMFPIVHLGKPWLFYWLAPYPNERGLWPNYRSPLLWDFFAINAYLMGSVIYLYLPLIPDLALVRARSHGLKRRIYALASLGWQGTQLQWARLEKAVQIMAVIIIPVAVSVHTIVSWDFAMAIQPMWHSTIFGPYFVAGAIFSGIAALIVAMAIIRKVFHLEEYLRPLHFNNLGLLLLTMTMIWFYFTFAEYLTTWYGNEPAEKAIFQTKVSGPYAPDVLGNGRVLFRDPDADTCIQAAADHRWNGRCFNRDCHRDVARKVLDHCADSFSSQTDFQLGELQAHVGRGSASDWNIRLLRPFVRGLYEGLSNSRGLGIQRGARSRSSRRHSTDTGGSQNSHSYGRLNEWRTESWQFSERLRRRWTPPKS